MDEAPKGEATEPIISRYTRRQAIADELLVDVSEQAAEAGIRIPVAVTMAVWRDACEWTESDDKRSRSPVNGQSTAGRLWDVLSMARFTLTANSKKNAGDGPLLYSVLRKPRPGYGRTRRITLKLDVSPGDAGEPVATILEPDED